MTRQMTMNDYVDLADKYLDVTLRSGDEYMAKCFVHNDSSASLQFNVKSGLWVCFACGAKGNAKSLIRHFGGTYRDPEVDVADIYAKLDLIDKESKTPVSNSKVPESMLKRYAFPTDYWASRGFTAATISAFDLGFDPIENEAIIPVRNIDGQLNGFIRRRLEKDYGPRYMYPKGFPRKLSLFGSWMVAKKQTDTVVITEGSLDSIKVWQAGYPAVAQYGSSLSPEQVVLLRRLGVSKVVLFFDNDKAGHKATETAIPLLRDFLIYQIEYKKRDASDPGAMNSATIKKRIDDADLIL